jgi:hypothetical protein
MDPTHSSDLNFIADFETQVGFTAAIVSGEKREHSYYPILFVMVAHQAHFSSLFILDPS